MKEAEVELLRDTILEEWTASLFGLSDADAAPGDFAVGVTADGDSYRLAVRVQTMSAAAEVALGRIRDIVGDDVEVRETGPIVGLQLWRHRTHRPLLIGSSCANRAVGTGTLGCFVRRNDDNALCVLSANHVLVPLNAVKADGTPLKDAEVVIDQPAPDDFAGGANVGNLVRAVRLRSSNNQVDAAIARVTVTNPPPNLTQLTGFGRTLSDVLATSAPNMIVYKIGRTTELRRGRVSAHGLKNLSVTIDGVSRGFDQQIEIESLEQTFSEEGDSGAIVFDDDGRPVGLLFGGSTDYRLSYASPIAEVLASLKCRIAIA